MKDIYVDVTLELDEGTVLQQPDPTAYIVETMRDAADRLCADNGAQLRTDRDPEFVVDRGQHRLLGIPVLLVASRWAVTAPDRRRCAGVTTA